MKINKHMLILQLLICSTCMAELNLAEKVVLKDRNEVVLAAYRDTNSCFHWEYVANRIVGSGPVHHEVELMPVTVKDSEYTALGTSILARASAAYTPEDLEQLKENIFKFLSPSEFSIPGIGKPVQNECYGAVRSPREIVLNPAYVQWGPRPPMSVSTPDAASSAMVHVMGDNSYNREDSAFFDPSAPTVVMVKIDGASPEADSRLTKMIADSTQGSVKVGQVSYRLKGFVAHVNATLKFYGKLRADWKSKFNELCHSKDNDHGLGGLEKDKLLECQGALEAAFMAGEFGLNHDFNDEDSIYVDYNGEAINLQLQDNAIPLREYVRKELWHLFFITNFTEANNRITTLVFEKQVSRDGEVRANVSFDTKYRTLLSGKALLNIPVYLHNLTGTVGEGGFNKRFVECAKDHYMEQFNKFRSYFTPIADECFKK